MIVVIPARLANISTIASVKIARFLGDYFECEVYGTDVEAKPLTTRPNTILYVGYPPVFAPLWWHENVVELILGCKRWVYCENDYNPNVTPTSKINTTLGRMGLTRFNKENTIRWTTLPDRVIAPGSSYVNWNLLTYSSPLIDNPPSVDALCYWGAPRPDRMKYFKRFLSDTPYTSVFSTTNPGKRKLEESTIRPTKFIPPFEDIMEMARYSFCLYLEDEYSHSHYCSPANRFYEALSIRRPILFDRNCIKTFETAGYDIEPFTVRTKEDVAEAMLNYAVIKNLQAEWYRDYREELLNQVDSAWKRLNTLT